MTKSIEATQRGMNASVKGFANENRLLGALLERGYNVSKVDLPHSSYDLVLEHQKDMIRIQVKTVGVGKSVSFTGGVRGGADREYKSDVKSYIQDTEKSDVVVGVLSEKTNGDTITFYVFPTIMVEIWGTKSRSINKESHAKNKYEYIERCKDKEFVLQVFGNA